MHSSVVPPGLRPSHAPKTKAQPHAKRCPVAVVLFTCLLLFFACLACLRACLLQQLCTLPALASSVSDLVATLLRGCTDIVPNVRLVAVQFLAEVVLAGGISRDRIAGEIK